MKLGQNLRYSYRVVDIVFPGKPFLAAVGFLSDSVGPPQEVFLPRRRLYVQVLAEFLDLYEGLSPFRAFHKNFTSRMYSPPAYRHIPVSVSLQQFEVYCLAILLFSKVPLPGANSASNQHYTTRL